MPEIKGKRKQLVRKTLMRAKAQGERAADQRQESPEEYAQGEVQQGIYDVAARTGNTAKSTARMWNTGPLPTNRTTLKNSLPVSTR